MTEWHETQPVSATGATGDDLDVIVVGGGQAGLAIGYFLAQHGRKFAILEAADEPAAAWRTRWDSLRLFTPARYSGLPGLPFGGDPDAYPERDAVVAYLTEYARQFTLPVVLGSRVRSVRRVEGRYLVEVDGRSYRADQVVVATGPFQVPFVPPIAERLGPEVFHLHSTRYRAMVRCWLWVAATPAFRLPKSSRPRVRFTCRSDRGRRLCLSGFSAATCSGTSRRPERCANRRTRGSAGDWKAETH